MTDAELSAQFRDFITCLNDQSWVILDAFVAEDLIHNGKPLGLAGYRQMFEQLHRELPNLHFDIELLIAEAPLLAARLKFDCGPPVSIPGLPESAVKVVLNENAFYKFRDGKICQIWSTVEAVQERQGDAAVPVPPRLPLMTTLGEDSFGSTDPKLMPPHFFYGAHQIVYATAIRADTTLQHCSVCPRHWYIDAHFRCADCGADILWSAEEQKVWFETYRFWIDSKPKHCRNCRSKRRDLITLRQEYDRLIGAARSGGTTEQKTKIVEIIDALEDQLGSIPDKLKETRDMFQKQIDKKNLQEP